MDLPNLLNRIKHKEEPIRRLLAIEISPSAVKSAVWQVHGMHTEMVATGSIQAWESDDITDLITAIDTSLSEALAGLESEPDEVVFGLPELWVNKTGIIESHKNTLKTICSKLSLKPVGFVVTTEAIVQYLRELEGGPPSAILINIGTDSLAVSIVYLGTLQGTQVVGRSDTISADVEEGLARFPKTDNLPSRMILYDSREDLESAKQALISHDWQAHLPFLHFPKIESLAKDFSIKAVALSGGAEVAHSLGYTQETNAEASSEPKTLVPDEEEEIRPKHSRLKLDIPPIKETPKPPVKSSETAETSADALPDISSDFGFTSLKSSSSMKETSSKHKTSQDRHPDDNLEPADWDDVHADLQDEEIADIEPASSPPKTKQHTSFKPPLVGLLALPGKLFSFLPIRRTHTVKSPAHRSPVKLFIVLGIILAVLGGAGFWAYWNLPKATVTIYLTPKPLDKQLTFTLDPNAQSVSINNKVLPGQKQTITVSGSQTAPATGTKTIGDKATGTVTLYNRTSSPKTFPAGTAIAYQDLKFTLSSDVTVASASTKYNADFSVTTQPSHADVAVTATSIGDQYNLGANTQFSVANFSADNYIATNAQAMSGGSSRQVPAVSESDIKQLKTELTNQLVSQVKDKVKAASAGKEAITTNDQQVSDQKLSAQAGDQADSVTLQMTLDQEVYTYSMNDVTLLAQQVAFADIPSGYNIQSDATQVAVQDATVNPDGTATISTKTTLSLIPQVDTQAVARQVTGKVLSVTNDYFHTLPGFVRSEIAITPKLPDALTTLPRRTDHITVTVTAATN